MTLNQWKSKYPNIEIIDKGDGYVGIRAPIATQASLDKWELLKWGICDKTRLDLWKWELWTLDDWLIMCIKPGVVWLRPRGTFDA